jgi:membrane protein implicated in regulation of membrane protease activity
MDIMTIGFADSWSWLIFVAIGLLLVMLELIIGVETGFDLVFVGTAFIIGGLVAWPFHSWVFTLIVTCVICLGYVFIGRRYVHRWKTVPQAKTNIDTIIGKTGIVLHPIAPNADGVVKVENEEWRARATENIGDGLEVVVTDITGVTLIVAKIEGGK